MSRPKQQGDAEPQAAGPMAVNRGHKRSFLKRLKRFLRRRPSPNEGAHAAGQADAGGNVVAEKPPTTSEDVKPVAGGEDGMKEMTSETIPLAEPHATHLAEPPSEPHAEEEASCTRRQGRKVHFCDTVDVVRLERWTPESETKVLPPPDSDDAPPDDAPPDDAPSDNAPSGNAPSNNAPSNNALSDNAPSENTPSDNDPVRTEPVKVVENHRRWTTMRFRRTIFRNSPSIASSSTTQTTATTSSTSTTSTTQTTPGLAGPSVAERESWNIYEPWELGLFRRWEEMCLGSRANSNSQPKDDEKGGAS